jgi:hypothetical protein
MGELVGRCEWVGELTGVEARQQINTTNKRQAERT